MGGDSTCLVPATWEPQDEKKRNDLSKRCLGSWLIDGTWRFRILPISYRLAVEARELGWMNG